MNHLHYNTLPEFYEKEKSGKKSNTVRAINADDYLEIRDANLITIHNKVTGDQFTRIISDVSPIGYIVSKKYIVISWGPGILDHSAESGAV